MGCGTQIVPNFNEYNKMYTEDNKNPALEMKMNQLFHAQGNKSTGEIEYRESNTASALEELSRQPGELGQMSRYLKGIGIQHSLRSKKSKRGESGVSLGGSTKWTPVGITVDPKEVGKNNKFDNLYDLLVAMGEDPKGPAAQYNNKLSDEQSIRMERAWIRKTGEDWQGQETSVEDFNSYL